MSAVYRIRIYHAILATLAIMAYLTGGLGLVHAWFGYGVAIVIILRLLWALSGERQVGLMRFYPSFEGLKFENAFTHPAISKSLMLGIALSLILAISTGFTLDKGKSIGLANVEIVTNAYADDDGKEEKKGFLTEALEESHELFANLMLLFVGMHVSYLLLFKRPLAKFMLFIPEPASKKTGSAE
jgi:cytochrome b